MSNAEPKLPASKVKGYTQGGKKLTPKQDKRVKKDDNKNKGK